MGIEIKELLIRAFVGNQQDTADDIDDAEDEEAEKGAQTAQDALSVITSMLKQEKER
ncbi:MAG: hypothetical protein ACXVPU_06930 [Bacteroidia bacterium]